MPGKTLNGRFPSSVVADPRDGREEVRGLVASRHRLRVAVETGDRSAVPAKPRRGESRLALRRRVPAPAARRSVRAVK